MITNLVATVWPWICKWGWKFSESWEKRAPPIVDEAVRCPVNKTIWGLQGFTIFLPLVRDQVTSNYVSMMFSISCDVSRIFIQNALVTFALFHQLAWGDWRSDRLFLLCGVHQSGCVGLSAASAANASCSGSSAEGQPHVWMEWEGVCWNAQRGRNVRNTLQQGVTQCNECSIHFKG